MRKSISLAAFATTLALSACGSTTTPANTSAEPSSTTTASTTSDTTTPDNTTPGTNGSAADVSALVDRDWKVDGLITVGGIQPVAEDSTAALRFTDNGDGTGTIELNAGCNTGGGDVTYDSADELTIESVETTLMACADEINDLEANLVGMLAHPQSWRVDGDELTLIPLDISDSGLKLHDAASTPPPTTIPTPTTVPTTGTAPGPSVHDMQRLLGTEWIPERFITVGPLDPIPGGSGASLEFEDATSIAIKTGCNSGSGTVEFADDGSFTVTDITMTEIACDDISLEIRILALLEHPLQWGIDEDTLTIYPLDVTDTGMILRDAEAPVTETPTTVTEQDAAAADRAAILAASVVHRFQGAPSGVAEVAIVDKLGASGTDGTVVFGPSDVAVTDDERAAVEAALASVTVRWVPSTDDPALQAATAAGQVGAVITLSDPAVEGDAATVVSGVYCVNGAMCGEGGGVSLDRQPDGSWKIGEPFGSQWIS